MIKEFLLKSLKRQKGARSEVDRIIALVERTQKLLKDGDEIKAKVKTVVRTGKPMEVMRAHQESPESLK